MKTCPECTNLHVDCNIPASLLSYYIYKETMRSELPKAEYNILI